MAGRAVASDAGEMAEHARALLTDHFERIAELVQDVTDGLDEQTATWRPAPEANTIAWLTWHLARVQDDHIADLAGTGQAWPRLHKRSGLPFGVTDTGYGHTPDQVAAVQVPPSDLREYHAAVHEHTIAYVRGLDARELERVVGADWDPPVTVSVRLVSVIGDCLQHLGQAAYLRGIAPG